MMRMLCNELVAKARAHLDAPLLFAREPLEAVAMLTGTLKVRIHNILYYHD